MTRKIGLPLFCALLAAWVAGMLVLAAPLMAQRAPNSLFRRAPVPGGEATILVPEGWVLEADSTAGIVLRLRTADGQVALERFADRIGPRSDGPAPAARSFLADVVAREARAGARNLALVDQRSLPELSRAWERRPAGTGGGAGVVGEAAAVTLEYELDGTPRVERLCGVVESGPDGWAGRAIFGARTPAGEFERWEPWLSFALASCEPAVALGADVARNALGLSLPGESLWRNPHSGALDPGSFHFGRYRWVTPDGDVIYSFNETFTPNAGRLLGRDDWSKSLPR